jgi:hypothetical protein
METSSWPYSIGLCRKPTHQQASLGILYPGTSQDKSRIKFPPFLSTCHPRFPTSFNLHQNQLVWPNHFHRAICFLAWCLDASQRRNRDNTQLHESSRGSTCGCQTSVAALASCWLAPQAFHSSQILWLCKACLPSDRLWFRRAEIHSHGSIIVSAMSFLPFSWESRPHCQQSYKAFCN